ncbi:MAG: methylated-DNA--[protein]-cysteine S-methyltransferase [Methylocystaceae bacterium]
METTHLIPTAWGNVKVTSRGSMLSRLLLPIKELEPAPSFTVNSETCDYKLSEAVAAYFLGKPVCFQVVWSDPELTETYKLARYWWNQIVPSISKPLLTVEIPLDLSGIPPASRKILAATAAIPYGCTISYGELSNLVYSDNHHARGVGSAMRINPIPLIIPCHRVVAKSGIGGFSGGTGVDYKEQMLVLEQQSLI